jgi:hypothetical protein
VDDYLAIFETDLSDIEKISRAFDLVTSSYIQHSEQDIELIRAMSDKDALIKEQIKMETIKHIRSIFNDCYKRSTGKKAWND